MDNVLERLKVLLDSSTPIVVMETVEEVRAVRLVRAACSALNLTAFEWTIASGLARSGSGSLESRLETEISGGYRAGMVDEVAESAKALYESRDPAKMLGNLEGITIEAAFILKDLHRHMDDPVVVRRLRDVGQKFATNRPQDFDSCRVGKSGRIPRAAHPRPAATSPDYRRGLISSFQDTHVTTSDRSKRPRCHG
jgi:hypothetical protein